MSLPPERSIRIELYLKAGQPELLEGLDALLRLGLISDAQVRQLCRQYLCSPLPEPVAPPAPEPEPEPEPAPQPVLAFSGKELPTPRLPRGLQSLMAEISVRWLLFLGVFMVVASSGLLAASQWQKFPAAGQYGVLLAYTLVFWGVSYWALPQPSLRLTAQTLQLVTLLLVPVNFWAMDGFKLWGDSLGWLTVAIATVALTGITVLLLKNQQSLSRRNLLNSLGLSYLHWGWNLPGFPLLAVYLGIVGTALACAFKTPNTEEEQQQPPLNTPAATPLTLPSATVVGYALGILLLRAIFVPVDISQLGLAIGICGWLFPRLYPQSSYARREIGKQELLHAVSQQIGGGLLFFGWLVSASKEPQQALAVSGLGLWWLAKRLWRFWQRADLAAISITGLQALWLTWRLVPPALQQFLVATATQLFGIPETDSRPLLSLALFPYLLFTVWLTDWLHRQSAEGQTAPPELAKFSGQLALAFGSCLTFLSLPYPSLRTLNLLASSLTLATVTRRRTPTRVWLVYLTHISALLTFSSAINWIWPSLSLGIWAAIYLAIAVGEWSFTDLPSNPARETLISFIETQFIASEDSVRENQRRFIASETSALENQTAETARHPSPNPQIPALIWQQSTWHLGLALAGVSYCLLLANYFNFLYNFSDSRPEWGILWLAAPIALTAAASRSDSRRKQASSLSTAASLMAQLLTLTLPGARLITLAVATAVMFVNTRYLRLPIAAWMTVGMGLSFFFLLLGDGIPGLPPLSPNAWLVTVAATVTALWGWRGWLVRSLQYAVPDLESETDHLSLSAVYAPAADKWAIALFAAELAVLTLHSFAVYWQFTDPSLAATAAAALITGAIAYRGWQQLQNRVIYSFGWSLEVLAAEVLGFAGREALYVAIANIALGLIAQLAGDWWHRHSRNLTPSSLHLMPLLYGAFAALLRWGSLTAWTGFTTLGLALIALGVGRRREEFKPLAYIALIGVSASAWEILWYQISPLAAGDQLIALATLGAILMSAYRTGSPALLDYLRLTEKELKVAAHLHWIASSWLLLTAIGFSIKLADLVGLSTGMFLTSYAILQGRHNPSRTLAEIWVYAGILEASALAIYIGSKLQFGGLLLPWAAALSAVAAYFLWAFPWESWGWPKQPWLRSAVVLPVAAALQTAHAINPASLLIVAAFYIFLARLNRQIRITYVSAFFINWSILRWFFNLNVTDALAYTIPPALSLLYIAQVDAGLQLPQKKPIRHFLRLLGVGAICFVALLTSNWLISGSLSLLAIFAGLAFRVRAFLYVGTAAFLLNAVNQLIILSQEYSFVKWVIGLLVGSILIWVGATFETRREQILSLVQNWFVEFEEWE